VLQSSFVSLAALLVAFSAHGKIKIKELPMELQKVQSNYIRGGTLVAEFEQVNKTAALGTEKKSAGLLMVKRPDKVRWETLKPDKNLLVSDGQYYWFYTPPFDDDERGQVIEKRTSEVQSKLANALLSGSFSDLSNMRIKKSGIAQFTLTPKKGTAATLKKAVIEIDPTLNLIKLVHLFHEGGNESRISLSKIRLGEKLDERYFSFVAPPNTDKVKQ
jgi:outer membrane lipoprotein carrier protein